MQETYLRAYAAFAGHHGPSTRAWLVAICLNLARSQGRRQARRPREAPLASAPEAASVAHGVAEQALAGLDRDRVAAALAQLPEDQRRAIVLMDLAGHTAAEVAEMLGRPRNTVLSWAFRGRQRLAAVLNEEGADHDLL